MSVVATNVEVGGHSKAVLPPSHEEITSFLLHYSGMRSVCLLEPPPAFSYSGCDYALVLYAFFPSLPYFDLTSLCWASTPLSSQLLENLSIFCTVAKRLSLPGTPYSSLDPSLLTPVPENTFHHLVVQHWLYVVGQRMPMSEGFDAVALRVVLRADRLGEPLLKKHRKESLLHDTLESPCSVQCAPCQSPVELEDVGLAIAPVPPFSEAASKPSEVAVPPPVPKAEEKPKPWLSYSKPWLLPGAKTKTAAAPQKKSTQSAPQPWESAFTESSSNLVEQYQKSEKFVRLKRGHLMDIKKTILEECVATGVVEFNRFAELLKKEVDTSEL